MEYQTHMPKWANTLEKITQEAKKEAEKQLRKEIREELMRG